MIGYIICGIVGLAILSFPLIFNIFGKENGCNKSQWDKWKDK